MLGLIHMMRLTIHYPQLVLILLTKHVHTKNMILVRPWLGPVQLGLNTLHMTKVCPSRSCLLR